MSELQWITCDSSACDAYAYDVAQTLTVRYKSGSVYEYYNVPMSVFDEFEVATSAGQFINENIKDTYEYSQIG